MLGELSGGGQEHFLLAQACLETRQVVLGELHLGVQGLDLPSDLVQAGSQAGRIIGLEHCLGFRLRIVARGPGAMGLEDFGVRSRDS